MTTTEALKRLDAWLDTQLAIKLATLLWPGIQLAVHSYAEKYKLRVTERTNRIEVQAGIHIIRFKNEKDKVSSQIDTGRWSPVKGVLDVAATIMSIMNILSVDQPITPTAGTRKAKKKK